MSGFSHVHQTTETTGTWSQDVERLDGEHQVLPRRMAIDACLTSPLRFDDNQRRLDHLQILAFAVGRCNITVTSLCFLLGLEFETT